MTDRFALSTIWRRNRFPTLRVFFTAAETAGFERFVLDRSITLRDIADFSLPEGQIPAIELPCPAHPDTAGAQFASLDRYEREAAREAARNSLQLAADLRAEFLLVRLGRVDLDRRLEAALVEAWRASGGEGGDLQDLRRELIEARAGRAEAHLEAAMYDVEYLAGRALQHNLKLGLLPPLHYTGFPLPEELATILSEFGDPVCYWHDTGQARYFQNLELLPESLWLETSAGQTAGAHLHDVRGLQRGLPPMPDGEVAFAGVAAQLPPTAHLVCTFAGEHSPEAVEAGRRALVTAFEAGAAPATAAGKPA